MQPGRPIEFRLLQVQLNPIADERRTLVLVHWDGAYLRVAWTPSVPVASPVARHAVAATVREVVRAAVARRTQPVLPMGLDAIVPVHEGSTAMLTWSPKRTGMTRDPVRHFEELSSALSLHPVEGESINQPPRWIRFDAKLQRLGEQLRANVREPQRVAVDRDVAALTSYRSPLSWLNSCWHHSFPINLLRSTVDEVDERVERAIGRIDTSLPDNDAGVLCIAYRETLDVSSRLGEVESFLRKRFDGRISCIRAPARDGEPSLKSLESRIMSDVGG